MKTAVRAWLPLGIVTTMLCGLMVVCFQHIERSAADDLPMQLAVDMGDRLRHGTPPQSLTGLPIDLSKSTAPFAIIVNGSGTIVASSADLPGSHASIPIGVLNAAREQGMNRITWQPADGVRIALAVIPAHDNADSVVIAGHSLKPFEQRIADVQGFVLTFWLITLLLTFAAVWWSHKQ